ncbi:hypothetical protein [Calidifontibacillus oryziterrae]|uniref:hypothetical protein n=1 Tax=Calidifontibacillus oryziterrae TaxID=1191699 RepID=UPI0002D63037|nr:hypothetical protein [Calidifontibacillus oryziterrae]
MSYHDKIGLFFSYSSKREFNVKLKLLLVFLKENRLTKYTLIAENRNVTDNKDVPIKRLLQEGINTLVIVEELDITINRNISLEEFRDLLAKYDIKLKCLEGEKNGVV